MYLLLVTANEIYLFSEKTVLNSILEPLCIVSLRSAPQDFFDLSSKCSISSSKQRYKAFKKR